MTHFIVKDRQGVTFFGVTLFFEGGQGWGADGGWGCVSGKGGWGWGGGQGGGVGQGGLDVLIIGHIGNNKNNNNFTSLLLTGLLTGVSR